MLSRGLQTNELPRDTSPIHQSCSHNDLAEIEFCLRVAISVFNYCLFSIISFYAKPDFDFSFVCIFLLKHAHYCLFRFNNFILVYLATCYCVCSIWLLFSCLQAKTLPTWIYFHIKWKYIWFAIYHVKILNLRYCVCANDIGWSELRFIGCSQDPVRGVEFRGTNVYSVQLKSRILVNPEWFICELLRMYYDVETGIFVMKQDVTIAKRSTSSTFALCFYG